MAHCAIFCPCVGHLAFVLMELDSKSLVSQMAKSVRTVSARYRMLAIISSPITSNEKTDHNYGRPVEINTLTVVYGLQDNLIIITKIDCLLPE